MKYYSLLLLILFIPLISAEEIIIHANSTTLNSTYMNSSITFSIDANASYLSVSENFIYIQNATVTRGSTVYICDINLTTNNTILDSYNFCPVGGGGGGGAGVPPPKKPLKVIEISEVEINYTILILLWLIIFLIFLIISFLLDRYRRENIIGLKVQLALIFISAIVLFLIGLFSQGILFSYQINIVGYQINFAENETKIVMGILTGILTLWFLFLWLIVEKSRFSKN